MRRHRVAGVDQPDERVLRLDLGDVRDGLHIEQRGDARHQVLAKGSGAREDVRVAARLLARRREATRLHARAPGPAAAAQAGAAGEVGGARTEQLRRALRADSQRGP